MAQGINSRTRLGLSGGDIDTMKRELQRWGSGLPFGAAGFHVKHSANQAVGAGATGTLTFDTVVQDREKWATAATTQFVVPPGLSGVYILNAGILLAAALVGQWLTIEVNGVSIGAAATNGVVTDHVVASGVAYLKEKDIITCQLFNQAGVISTSTTFGGNNLFPAAPFLSAWRISLL